MPVDNLIAITSSAALATAILTTGRPWWRRARLAREGRPGCSGGNTCFWLSYEAAKAALKPREKLDAEDFPISADPA